MIKTLWGSLIILLCVSCSQKSYNLRIQKPPKIEVPKNVQKIIIQTSSIRAEKDALKLKKRVIKYLQSKLSRLGRFKVIVVEEITDTTFDTEKEQVALIQGEIISRAEVDPGQYTEKATCQWSVGGFASAAFSLASKEAVTVSHRLIPCFKDSAKNKATNFAAQAVTGALIGGAAAFTTKSKDEGLTGGLLGAAGAITGGIGSIMNQQIATDEVVRTYRYRNVSLFAQLQLSLTILGETRETLAIRSATASFGKQIIDLDSYKNVNHSYSPLESFLATIFVPTPLLIRESAVADRSLPKKRFYTKPQLDSPKLADLPPKERKKLTSQLIKKISQNFIRTIAPYRVTQELPIASGSIEVEKWIQRGQWKIARARLEKLPSQQRSHGDWYNLALTYEAGAEVIEDYEEAKRLYATALEKAPDQIAYAQGIGRIERRLQERKNRR